MEPLLCADGGPEQVLKHHTELTELLREGNSNKGHC